MVADPISPTNRYPITEADSTKIERKITGSRKISGVFGFAKKCIADAKIRIYTSA